MFQPPTQVSATVMPIKALEGAEHCATGVALLSAAELRRVDACRSVLASKDEVIIEMRCCDGKPR